MYRITLIISILIFSIHANATNYYVSTTGTSSGSGSFSSPLTFTAAIAKSLTAGDTIFVRGGMYNFSAMQSISKSGNATSKIHFEAYQGEIPVFDFRTQSYGSSNQGVKISANYVHFKGITIQGAGDNGLQVTGSNNHIENCNFRWNSDSGLQMKTGSNNLIENCDSYENFDYQTGGTSSPDYGGNADGFADKQYTNTGVNRFVGCRAWSNSDDGWDLYEKIGNTEIDSSWCYLNGPASFDMSNHIRFKTDSASWFSKFKNSAGKYVITNYGNGNGFKLGGNYTASNSVLRNCVAVSNTVKGFDQNNSNGNMTLFNCTAYSNGSNYGFSNSSYGNLIIRNCASLSGSNNLKAKTVTQTNNSWNTGFSCLATDFVSLDKSQMLTARNADGSLGKITLLQQTSTSSMIDKGMNVGLTFTGAAPDLGAFEYSPTTALPENIASLQKAIYYNPSTNSLQTGNFVGQIQIFDINGKLVYQQNHFRSSGSGISTQNWTKGIYLYRFRDLKGEFWAGRIMIM